MIISTGSVSLCTPNCKIPVYDTQGQRAGSVYYEVEEGAVDRPYLSVIYQFFDSDNLSVDGTLVDAQK